MLKPNPAVLKLETQWRAREQKQLKTTSVLVTLPEEALRRLDAIVVRMRESREGALRITSEEMNQFRKIATAQGAVEANRYMRQLRNAKKVRYGARQPSRSSVALELLKRRIESKDFLTD